MEGPFQLSSKVVNQRFGMASEAASEAPRGGAEITETASEPASDRSDGGGAAAGAAGAAGASTAAAAADDPPAVAVAAAAGEGAASTDAALAAARAASAAAGGRRPPAAAFGRNRLSNIRIIRRDVGRAID